jgi:acyl-CoA synthetase (AMP-forming)/AMP-acid ligase II
MSKILKNNPHKKTSKEYNVVSLLHRHALKHPKRLAFKWGETESISYNDFSEKIFSIASNFKKLGIKKGDRILIFIPLSLDLYLCMFALQHIGAIAVFLDSWARRDQLSICANIVSPKAMISFDKAFKLCEEIPELENISTKIVIDHSNKKNLINFKSMIKSKESCPIQEVLLEDTALITFTTGSSGKPKGANRTHGFLLAQHNALKEVILYNGNETDLPIFPIFALNNLASGITTLLPDIDLASPTDNDGEILATQISSHKTESCTLSPSLFIKIADYCNKNQLTLPSLKRVVTGGAPISEDNVKQFKILAPDAEILILYGSTEVEPIAHIEANEMLASLMRASSMLALPMRALSMRANTGKKEGVNVGHISKDLEYKFIKITKDPIQLSELGFDEWEVKKGQIGELIVSGLHVCENYYNDEDAFKRAKIRDKTGKIWHRTGDLCFIDSQKFLWFVGRVHNVIERSGQFLFPVQAELLLKQLPFVRQAAFLGLKDKILGQKTFAVISLKPNFEDNESEDKSYVEKIIKILKENKIPIDQVKIIDEIPMDPRHHSKVEYSKLKEILNNG